MCKYKATMQRKFIQISFYGKAFTTVQLKSNWKLLRNRSCFTPSSRYVPSKDEGRLHKRCFAWASQTSVESPRITFSCKGFSTLGELSMEAKTLRARNYAHPGTKCFPLRRIENMWDGTIFACFNESGRLFAHEKWDSRSLFACQPTLHNALCLLAGILFTRKSTSSHSSFICLYEYREAF